MNMFARQCKANKQRKCTTTIQHNIRVNKISDVIVRVMSSETDYLHMNVICAKIKADCVLVNKPSAWLAAALRWW